MKRLFYLILFIAILFASSSCRLRKNTTYFQNSSAEQSASNYTPKLKKDDLLQIKVISDNVEAAIPFNIPEYEMRINSNAGYVSGNQERNGYLIDENGDINFPIIGKVRLNDLSRLEATELLESLLIEYLSNPIVNIQILNYKITVLGDVTTPGTFKIPNERITVIEAIGLAGDMQITGKRDNILVIRDRDGVKTEYRLDFRDVNSVFSSPVYYLEQNDVVYVEPNSASRSEGSFWKRTGSILLSLASIIISTLAIVFK